MVERLRDAHGYFVRRTPDPAKWEPIRIDYESGNGTEAEIQKRHGVTKGEFDHRKRDGGWPKRRATQSLSRPMIIGRIFAVLEKQISKLENDVKKTDGPTEAALLGSVVATLGKLVEIDRREARREPAPESKDMSDLRARIGKRIEQLNQG